MQDLAVFEFPGNQQDVNVYVDQQNRPWFRATNVCAILGFSNPFEALKSHCPDSSKEYSIGRGRPSNYVSESGLYRLMLASKAPMAERFRDWVCDEVLPAIRKTGSFGNVPNVESGGSEFWQLIDGAIARGLEPETAIDLHHRYQSPALAGTKAKTPKLSVVRPKDELSKRVSALVVDRQIIQIVPLLEEMKLPTEKSQQMIVVSILKKLGWTATLKRNGRERIRSWQSPRISP